ncbi:MAG: FAD-binding protein [Nitrososphaerota archaeon]|nr:FAD-binding protein [Candidatus Bathyarchaeota archaeon]MDW8023724.1 FAD-binding protein [Nitrososphaerota archaeon]
MKVLRIEEWHYQTDVVVVGFGYAGACAAIAAHDAGAEVLIIEKAPERFAGGNSRVSGGGMRIPLNFSEAAKCFKAMFFGTVPEDDVTVVVEALGKVPEQLKAWGIDVAPLPPVPWRGSTLPEPVRGLLQSCGLYSIVLGGKPALDPLASVGAGYLLYEALKRCVVDRGIRVLYEASAKKLIQNSVTREILGVVAQMGDRTVYVKARKATVLACGGYENNYEMWVNFNFPGVRVYPWGSPYNTGDGIKMVLDVGAALWHMVNVEWDSPCIKIPSEIYGCAVQTRAVGALRSIPGSYIVVNRYGKRFMNECKSLVHRKEPLEITYFSHEQAEYPNIPFYLIFDEAFRVKGPLVPKTPMGWNGIFRLYDWSDDNTAEIEKGWIIKADTIRELAIRMNLNPAGLEDTIKKYNMYCKMGEDPEFNRPPDKMLPITTPPFYGVELALTLTNTQGGPKHNIKAQVLDTENKPIPRLYVAGELGSFWGFLYPGGGNIAEAIAFGRIAGENAAAEKQWE